MPHVRSIGSAAAIFAAACWWMNPPRMAAQQDPVAPTMFVLTLHPHVTGHRSPMRHRDEFVTYMKSKPGVWLATGELIARCLKSAQPRWICAAGVESLPHSC